MRARWSRSRSTPAASTPRQRRRWRRARWRSARRRTTWWMRGGTYFERVLKWLLVGNVRRGQLYPLCVGAERTVQAQVVAEMAATLGTDTIAHGCTAAGNDQVRFEVALRTLAPGIEILAPVRDESFKRPEQLAYLESRGLPVPPHRRRLLHQPRTLGRHHRRARDADVRGQHPGIRVGALPARFRRATHAAAGFDRVRARRPVGPRRRAHGPGRADRGRGSGRRPVRHRPRHPPRRHHHRHQGPRRFRGARRRRADRGAPRAREARARRAPAAREGPRRGGLRRSRARGPEPRSRVPRHRGAVRFVAGARDGHRERAAAPGLGFRRGRRVRRIR